MIVTSKGILNIKGLSTLVGEPVLYSYDPRVKISSHACVAGWGRKKSFFKAKQYAEQHHKKLVCLEDGFIRSLGLGKAGAPPLSVVMDYSGIYFDAMQSSDLEKLIAQDENTICNQRAKKLIEKIIRYGITKYNNVYQSIDIERFAHQDNVLVIDQTYGDQSIYYAGANESTFVKMLEQALLDYPEATIWVKTHPDVQAGHAKSHFKFEHLHHPRVRVCTEAYHPLALLEQMSHVYVVSSQMGFEALLCGKQVTCFGLPWYAGWGLTDDQYAPNEILKGRRHKSRSLLHLFSCAYVQYARYISPVHHRTCQLEELLELLNVNIKFQKQFIGVYQGYHFSRWKRIFIRDFLNFTQTKFSFKQRIQLSKYSPVVAWGKYARALKHQGYRHVVTVEDGFVRSRGLGANLTRPYSLVFDDIGIYYDATCASKLEQILNAIRLNDTQETRAKNIINQLIKLNITKYNIGDNKKLPIPSNAYVILVVGQVEDDLSIRYGGVSIKTNLDLLKIVRKNNPQSYIIYKPHPDVQAGLRVGYIASNDVFTYADRIETTSSILECFDICHEVHTICSLSGFEALIRGIKVFCYGMPFYAGWGLTHDVVNCSRRKRTLSIEELVHGVLIDYAMYNLPNTAQFGIPLVNIEDVIDQIVEEKSQDQFSPRLLSTFARLRAKILHNTKRQS